MRGGRRSFSRIHFAITEVSFRIGWFGHVEEVDTVGFRAIHICRSFTRP